MTTSTTTATTSNSNTNNNTKEEYLYLKIPLHKFAEREEIKSTIMNSEELY